MSKPDLRPNENILFPNPYVEDERPPVIVTTMRVFNYQSGKKQEFDSSKITYTGKGNDRRILGLMALLVIVGLPFFGIGLYNYLNYRDLPRAKPEPIKGVPEKMYTKKELETFDTNAQRYLLGIVLGGFGAAFGGGAYLLRKRRFVVVIGGDNKRWQLNVKDGIEQDKLLTMVGASQTSAKSMAVKPMPQKVMR